MKRRGILLLLLVLLVGGMALRLGWQMSLLANPSTQGRAERFGNVAVSARVACMSLPGSIVELSPKDIVRAELTPDEQAEPRPFRVALKMRDLQGLRERIYRNEIISQQEMKDKYYPTQADVEAVTTWLQGAGLQVRPVDLTGLSIEAIGSTANVAQVLQTKFVRVRGRDGQSYTSASAAPSLPKAWEPFLIGVTGLQPQLQIRKHAATLPPAQNNGLLSVGFQAVAQYYNALGLGYDGTGQVIGIVGAGVVLQTDLNATWQHTGLAATYAPINLTIVNPWGNPIDSTGAWEDTIDVTWAAGMAPGAKIRQYYSNEAAQFVPAILADLANMPGLLQVSWSDVSGENASFPAAIQTDSQYYAALAAAGVTFFNSSGDFGQGGVGGTPTLQVPASDPCVTAVGGTTMRFNNVQVAPDLPIAEWGWQLSGGGTSVIFARPSWQKGNGVPAGTMRLVPDVAGPASGDLILNAFSTYVPADRGFYLVYQGSTQAAGGTSLSSPVWAGLCALINQARNQAGLSPVGLLGPRIYPLIGTNAFNDITLNDGRSNSEFGPVVPTTAGPGWDNCTGCGTPNIGNLIQALVPSDLSVHLPTITTQPTNQTVNAGGTVTLSLTAITPSDPLNTAPILSYQWFFDDSLLGHVILSNGGQFSGANTATLTITNVQKQNTNDSQAPLYTRTYGCAVQNQYGFTFSNSVTITLNGPPTITGAGYPSIPPVVAGHNVSFSGTAIGPPTPAIYWQSSTNGTTWTNLSDNGTYSGTQTATLTITAATAALDGTQFRFVANNSFGTVTSTASTLDVNPAAFSEPTGLAVSGTTTSNVTFYVSDAALETLQTVTDSFAYPLAGTADAAGSTDGTGSSARFNQPMGVAVDSSGNVYVADTGNDTIRKVTSTGIVTTLAGTAGAAGSTDGTGSSARFNQPMGVAVDSSGNVYVADTSNDTIRKVTSTGIVTTLAGTAGAAGSTDGTGSSARFNQPMGVVVDSSGNVYVADTGNDTIRMITPASVVTTLAGQAGVAGLQDGTGPQAWFNQPSGLVLTLLSGHSYLYVADSDNDTIREVQLPTSTVSTLTILPSGGPSFTLNPASTTVAQGSNASFNVTVNVSVNYQWQRLPFGTGTWTNLSDGSAYGGTKSSSLAVSGTTGTMNGDQFRCVATNGAGSATSNAATLTVTTPSNSPSPSSGATSSSGGGGGALSYWFVVVLALLATVRQFGRRPSSP